MISTLGVSLGIRHLIPMSKRHSFSTHPQLHQDIRTTPMEFFASLAEPVPLICAYCFDTVELLSVQNVSHTSVTRKIYSFRVPKRERPTNVGSTYTIDVRLTCDPR
jgi:hypothetical protein